MEHILIAAMLWCQDANAFATNLVRECKAKIKTCIIQSTKKNVRDLRQSTGLSFNEKIVITEECFK